MENKVTDYLNKEGFKRNLMGFRYLRTAIVLVIQDWKYIEGGVTKFLYPEVAKMHNTTASKVERAIRHSIEVVYGEGKPCNSEFIALVADTLKMQEKNTTVVEEQLMDGVDKKIIVDALEFYKTSKESLKNSSNNLGFKQLMQSDIDFIDFALKKVKADA